MIGTFPQGLDRADGLSGRAGTPTPAAAIKIQSADGPGLISFQESPDSPEFERAEQATIRKTFTCSYSDALTLMTGLARGTFMTDSNGNVFRILSSRIVHREGNAATLEVVAESISFDTPPDEFDLNPVELGINIMKHPRYFYALQGSFLDLTNQQNQETIQVLQYYMDNPLPPSRSVYVQKLRASFGHQAHDSTGVTVAGTDLAKQAALEIITKYWNNEETPYIVGLELRWSQYYFSSPFVTLGGYVEDPFLGVNTCNPGVPDFFTNSDTFLNAIPALNPQCYSSDGTSSGGLSISWLRKADQIHYQRTWFRLDRIWMGAPVGHWDPQLYSTAHRPAATTDYLAFSPNDPPPLP